MSVFGLAIGWYIGWAIGLVVVLLAASLLLTIIFVGRRIISQAVDITRALDGARTNTDPLWDVRNTNHAVDRITRGLAAARRMLGG
jgi:hypothetical protein